MPVRTVVEQDEGQAVGRDQPDWPGESRRKSAAVALATLRTSTALPPIAELAGMSLRSTPPARSRS